MIRLPCNHAEANGKKCTFTCLEYGNLEILIIGKHTDRGLRVIRHENRIKLAELLGLAVDEGHGKKLLEIILEKMSAERLTDVFEQM